MKQVRDKLKEKTNETSNLTTYNVNGVQSSMPSNDSSILHGSLATSEDYDRQDGDEMPIPSE